jgi:hypothetical protein
MEKRWRKMRRDGGGGDGCDEVMDGWRVLQVVVGTRYVRKSGKAEDSEMWVQQK